MANSFNKNDIKPIQLRRINPEGKTLLKLNPEDDAQFQLYEEDEYLSGQEFLKLQLKITSAPKKEASNQFEWEITQAFLIPEKKIDLDDPTTSESMNRPELASQNGSEAYNMQENNKTNDCLECEPPSYNECFGLDSKTCKTFAENLRLSVKISPKCEANKSECYRERKIEILQQKLQNPANLTNPYAIELPKVHNEHPIFSLSEILEYPDYDPTEIINQHQIPIKQIISIQQLAEQHEHYDIDVEMDKYDLENYAKYMENGKLTLGSGPFKSTFVKHSPDEFVTVCQCVNCLQYRQIIMKYVLLQMTESKMLDLLLKVFTTYFGSMLKSPAAYNTFQSLTNQNKDIYWLTCGLLFNADTNQLKHFDHRNISNNVVMVLFSTILMIANPCLLMQILSFRVEAIVKAYAAGYQLSLQEPKNLKRDEAEVMLEYIISGYEDLIRITDQVALLLFSFERNFLYKLKFPWEILCKRIFQYNVFLKFEDGLLSCLLTLKEKPMTDKRAKLIKKFILFDEEMKSLDNLWPLVWMEINKFIICAPEYERRSNMSDVYRIFKSLATDALNIPEVIGFTNTMDDEEEDCLKNFHSQKDHHCQWLYTLNYLVQRWNAHCYKPPNTTICDDKCVNCNELLWYHDEKCECIACSIAGSPALPKNYMKSYCEACCVKTKNKNKDGKDLYESKLVNICANDDAQIVSSAKAKANNKQQLLKSLENVTSQDTPTNPNGVYHIAWAVFKHLPGRRPFKLKTIDPKYFCDHCNNVACLVAKKLLLNKLDPSVTILLMSYYQPLDVNVAELSTVAPNLRLFNSNLVSLNLEESHKETTVKILWIFVISLFAEHFMELRDEDLSLAKIVRYLELTKTDIRVAYRKLTGNKADNKFFDFLQFLNSNPCDEFIDIDIDKGFGEQIEMTECTQDDRIYPLPTQVFETDIDPIPTPQPKLSNSQSLMQTIAADQKILQEKFYEKPKQLILQQPVATGLQTTMSSALKPGATEQVMKVEHQHPILPHHQLQATQPPPPIPNIPFIPNTNNVTAATQTIRRKQRMIENMKLQQEQHFQRDLRFLHHQQLKQHEMMRKQRLQQAHQLMQEKQQIVQKQQMKKQQQMQKALETSQQMNNASTISSRPGQNLTAEHLSSLPASMSALHLSPQLQLNKTPQSSEVLGGELHQVSSPLQTSCSPSCNVNPSPVLTLSPKLTPAELAVAVDASNNITSSSSPAAAAEIVSPSESNKSSTNPLPEVQAKRNAKTKKCKSCFEHPELSEHCLNGHCSKKKIKKDCSHTRVNETRDRLRKKLSRLANARKNDQQTKDENSEAKTEGSTNDSSPSSSSAADEKSSGKVSSGQPSTANENPTEKDSTLSNNNNNDDDDETIKDDLPSPSEEKQDNDKKSKQKKKQKPSLSPSTASEKSTLEDIDEVPFFNSLYESLVYLDSKRKDGSGKSEILKPLSKKATKKLKQKLRKEESKRIAELGSLKTQYELIYFKEFVSKLNLKNNKSNKKKDTKKIVELENSIKNLQRAKAKIEMNILELIATVKQTNTEFKFSYLPTKEQQSEKLEELKTSYYNEFTNLNKQDIDKLVRSLLKLNMQNSDGSQSRDSNQTPVDKQLEQGEDSNPQQKLINAQSNSNAQCFEINSMDYDPSQAAANYPYPLHLQQKPVALGFLGKPIFQPMCYGGQPTQPLQQIVSEVSNDAATSSDPSKRIVTIRRINMPNASEPQVTVTAKGASPDKDKLLYTFVNGQMVPTTPSAAAENMKNGVQYYEFPHLAAMTTMTGQIPTMTTSSVPMHVPLQPSSLMPMSIPIQMRYPTPHLMPGHPILVPTTHPQQVPVPVSMYQPYEAIPLQHQLVAHNQQQPQSLQNQSLNKKKNKKKNKNKVKDKEMEQEIEAAPEETYEEVVEEEAIENEVLEDQEDDQVEVKLSKKERKRRAAEKHRNLEQQIAEAAALAAAAKERYRQQQEKQLLLQQEKEKQEQQLKIQQQQKLKQKQNQNQSAKKQVSAKQSAAQTQQQQKSQPQPQAKTKTKQDLNQTSKQQQASVDTEQGGKQSKKSQKTMKTVEQVADVQPAQVSKESLQSSKKNSQNKGAIISNQNKNSKEKQPESTTSSIASSSPVLSASPVQDPDSSEKKSTESSDKSKRQKIVDQGQFDNNPYKALHMGQSDTDGESSRPSSSDSEPEPEPEPDIEPVEVEPVKPAAVESPLNGPSKALKKSKQQQTQSQSQPPQQQSNKQKQSQQNDNKKTSNPSTPLKKASTEKIKQKPPPTEAKPKEDKSLQISSKVLVNASTSTEQIYPLNNRQQKQSKFYENSHQNNQSQRAKNTNNKSLTSRSQQYPSNQNPRPSSNAQSNRHRLSQSQTNYRQDNSSANKNKKQANAFHTNTNASAPQSSRTAYNSTYYKNNENFDTESYMKRNQTQRPGTNKRNAKHPHSKDGYYESHADNASLYYKSNPSDSLANEMQSMHISEASKTYAYGNFTDDKSSSSASGGYSIMDQLKSGVQVENLSLPPGITLTKVDPIKSEELRQKSESIKKLSQPMQTQQAPQLEPGSTIIAPPFGSYFSNSAAYAAVASGPSASHFRMDSSGGVIMVEANAPHPTRSQSNDSAATTSSGKSSKNKKKKNKAKTNASEEVVAKPSSLDNGNQTKMITLRNPMFHGPDAARILQQNQIQAQRSMATNVYNPCSEPPAEPQAAIIKNENGIYTIRNPALHQAVTNGLAATGFGNMSNVSFYTPQEAAADAAKANAAKNKDLQESSAAAASESFSYFSSTPPKASNPSSSLENGGVGGGGAAAAPNNLNNISISCTSISPGSNGRSSSQNFINNGTDLGTEVGNTIKKPLSAIGSEIKNAQRQKPIVKESPAWPGFGLDLAENCVYRAGKPVTSGASATQEFSNISSLQDQYRKSSYYNGFEAFSGSVTSHKGAGSLFENECQIPHSCGDDSPPPSLTGYNSSYLEGIPNTGVIRYDDASFLKTLIPGQRLNNEVSIHSIGDSNFSRNSTSPLTHRVEISPIFPSSSPTGNSQNALKYHENAENFSSTALICDNGPAL